MKTLITLFAAGTLAMTALAGSEGADKKCCGGCAKEAAVKSACSTDSSCKAGKAQKSACSSQAKQKAGCGTGCSKSK